MASADNFNFRETFRGHICRYGLRVLRKWYALSDLTFCGTAYLLLGWRGIVIPGLAISVLAPLGIIIAGFVVWREDRLGIAASREKDRLGFQQQLAEEKGRFNATLETQRREADHANKFASLNLQRVESEIKSLRDNLSLAQILLTDRQYDRAKAVIDEESEREKQRLEKRKACLSKCQDILRHNPERPITLAGLLEAGTDKLDTTDDLIWVCNELAETSGNFIAEYGVVPPKEFLAFLWEIRACTVPANEIDTRQKCANFCLRYFYDHKP